MRDLKMDELEAVSGGYTYEEYRAMGMTHQEAAFFVREGGNKSFFPDKIGGSNPSGGGYPGDRVTGSRITSRIT